MTLIAQKYTFNCRFITEARLPGYLGSTLRGSLGWGLKKAACVLRRQQCGNCMLREQCVYAFIFETEKYTTGDGRNVNARPHPFVLQPHENSDKKDKDDNLSFSLLLFDRANTMLPEIVYAVRLMGEAGIGVGRKDGFGRFMLETVSTGEKTVFSAKDDILHSDMAAGRIQLQESKENGQTMDIHLSLETPLRLKYGNKLTRELPFHILIRAGLRRIAALEDAYGGGEPDLDYKTLVRTGEQISATESNIRWRELFRYSNRQRKKISLSGLSGTVIYKDVPTDFLPILSYSEQVNIGKQTVFGLGKIRITRSGGKNNG